MIQLYDTIALSANFFDDRSKKRAIAVGEAHSQSMALRVFITLCPLLVLVAWLVAPYAEAAPLAPSQIEQCPTELPPGQCCIHGDPPPDTPDPQPTYYVTTCPPGMGEPVTPTPLPPPPISSTPPVTQQPGRPAPSITSDTPNDQNIPAGTMYADRYRVSDADEVRCMLARTDGHGTSSMGAIACDANGMTEAIQIKDGWQYQLWIDASQDNGQRITTFFRRWISNRYQTQHAYCAYAYGQRDDGQCPATVAKITINRRGRVGWPVSRCDTDRCRDNARVRLTIGGRTIMRNLRLDQGRPTGTIIRRNLCKAFGGRRARPGGKITMRERLATVWITAAEGQDRAAYPVAGVTMMRYRGRRC